MRVIDYGRRALLIEASDGGEALGIYRAALDAIFPGTVDIVPAARTVLFAFRDEESCRRARPRVEALRPRSPVRGEAATVTIPVIYDGADLEAVATHCGLDVAGVVAAHTDSVFEVAFVGFAPGFAYLTGLDHHLHVPRLDSPRTSVPAGSVAIAGAHSAIYPGASPGGWRLLGRTDREIFDPSRESPALLTPGTRVRFEAVG